MQIDGKMAAPIHAFVVIRLLPARRKDGQGSYTNCIICKVLDLFFDDHHIVILVTWTQATNRFLPRWVECTPPLWIKLWTRLIMVLPSICLSSIICINMFIITFWPATASLYPSQPPPNLQIAKVKESFQRCKKRQMRQIYLCNFSANANFWAILGHFWAILGNFRSFLGHFLVLIFCGKICLCAI